MGRMKPQALLMQSKRKKGPVKPLGVITIIVCIVVIMTLLLSFMVIHRYRVKGRGNDLPFESTEEDILQEPRKLLLDRKWGNTLPHYAMINTTMGVITLELFGKDAPKAVENFVTHSQRGYYNGVSFHRVIKGFMIQGGDPKGDGTGGESIWGHPFSDEFKSSLKHEPFTLSMANSGPDTNGSQFFITAIATPHLDNKHTVFGRCVHGQNVVQEIQNVETDAFDRPLSPVVINSISISDEYRSG
ncbi:hypothetical protein O6H91_21G021600 [Diphasiastrum complanatum]|uniref:Uncharacterized protein n=2 Tax=Diphasiastrum complanatum TaxID=34168 RepID=A0ACC2AIM9_DIPCM|nr:hypothetical protein O6H91_21G021600 [Diphasiastrum complanatum]KAJ7517388.1 hypothetical protein O6H91_21G021600 [Diphasiastrum complanatum]